jgi:branched-chain amino acid transport system ATP-binding protein
MFLLEVSEVSLSFSGLRALVDVSLGIGPAEIVGLIGPNGAGKSTLVNCISCLYQPDSGSIHFDSTELVGLPAHKVASLGIRRTFQNLELFRDASVRENVTLGLVYRHQCRAWGDFLATRSSRAAQKAAIDEADSILGMFALLDLADVRVCDLPYGVQKLVELARALAGRPKLLLLDEPAAGMNPEESRGVADRVRHLRDRDGVAILLIEHDMRVVMNACDRIVVLDHGEKIYEGSPGEVRRSPAVVKAYLGEDVDDA